MKPLFLSVIFLCALIIQNVTGQSQVTIEENPFVIPTYEIGAGELAPIFYSGRTYQGAAGYIYPYPMYDKLSDNKKDKIYNAIFIENQYTRICIIPELVGRIFSAIDKTNSYDFFYRQHVIKPSLIGMTDAFAS